MAFLYSKRKNNKQKTTKKQKQKQNKTKQNKNSKQAYKHKIFVYFYKFCSDLRSFKIEFVKLLNYEIISIFLKHPACL